MVNSTVLLLDELWTTHDVYRTTAFGALAGSLRKFDPTAYQKKAHQGHPTLLSELARIYGAAVQYIEAKGIDHFFGTLYVITACLEPNPAE